MCSSCGGKAAARRLPGAIPQNPILFGDADDRPAQPVTFLVSTDDAVAGKYAYVSGDGVEAAVEAGVISLGYKAAGSPPSRLRQHAGKQPPFYVKTARDKWVGFKNKAAAERYATSVGSSVLTRAQVLAPEGDS